MVNKPLINLNKALFLGGGTLGGGRLNSHDIPLKFLNFRIRAVKSM